MNAVEAWELRHPGFEATAPVRLWLRSLEPLARALGGTPPDLITALGSAASIGAGVASPRRGAAALLVAGGVLDALDGMVAGAGSARGRAIDHAADRVADVALVSGLARAGAPGPLCVVAGAAVLAMEASRRGSTVVTPGERPTRIALGCLGLLGLPRVATWSLLGVSALSTWQLRADRRRPSS